MKEPVLVFFYKKREGGPSCSLNIESILFRVCMSVITTVKQRKYKEQKKEQERGSGKIYTGLDLALSFQVCQHRNIRKLNEVEERRLESVTEHCA